MPKRVNVTFNDDEFEKLRKIKDSLGLKWEDVIRKGLECLKEKMKPAQQA